jgi:NTE family protein
MGRVGLVLGGSAARGPYQAGALAELLPALAARDERPVVLLGTSSGALTAALAAQFADLPADVAAERIVATWVDVGAVFVNPLCAPGPGLALLARLGLPGLVAAPDALLDVAPLRARAGELFEPGRIAANVAAGNVDSVAVAATVCPPAGSAARTRLFVQGALPKRPLRSYVDVVPVPLNLDHLLASAAIPVLFPPVHVGDPAEFAGYHLDGGVRLNTPLGAALAMDVERLVVVSAHSVEPPPVPPVPAGNPPDLATVAAIALRAVLADGLADDLASVHRKNLSGRHPQVPYLLVAPRDGELAGLAAESFDPDGPGDPYWAIGRLLGAMGVDGGRDELLSMILFKHEYARRQVAVGRRDARAALEKGWLR